VRVRSALLALLTAAAALAVPATASAATTDVPPPGANDWSCKPSGAHPHPVVLVPGTFESMVKNWSTLSPYLKSRGYCVFALNYGTTNGIPATGPVADSARELAPFIDAVLAATKAKKVDVVGHSQGGMMPRYYLGFLGGATKVDALVGIAPSNHGTEGLITPTPEVLAVEPSYDNALCQACGDQQAGSPFMTELNSIGDTVKGPYYTVISTVYDEVVTPYQSQFLAGSAKQVTNITIQQKCPLDLVEHDQAPNDPVVHQLVAHALGRTGAPANPAFQPRCV
jgi:triacylglycerol lipase